MHFHDSWRPFPLMVCKSLERQTSYFCGLNDSSKANLVERDRERAGGDGGGERDRERERESQRQRQRQRDRETMLAEEAVGTGMELNLSPGSCLVANRYSVPLTTP